MLFKKFFKLLVFVLISVAAILGLQDILAEHPLVQAATTWSAVAITVVLFMYFLCRETKYSMLGLDTLRILLLIPAIAFVLWLLNTLLKVINIIPLIAGDSWRIGNIWSEPYMSISIGAGVVAGFILLLINYWSDDLGVSLKLSPEIER